MKKKILTIIGEENLRTFLMNGWSEGKQKFLHLQLSPPHDRYGRKFHNQDREQTVDEISDFLEKFLCSNTVF